MATTGGPVVEAEKYDRNSPIAPFVIQAGTGGMEFITTNMGMGDVTVPTEASNTAQAYYSLKATATQMTVYATANLATADSDSFHYEIAGLSVWATKNGMQTAGFEEFPLLTVNNAVVGTTYILKIQRREAGAQFDKFRIEGGAFLDGVPGPVLPPPPPQNMVNLVIGTYTLNGPGSQGIYSLGYDLNSGKYNAPKLLAAAVNPTWMYVQGHTLYSTNEVKDRPATITTYTIEADGSATQIGKTDTTANEPTYLSMSPDKKYLAAGCYNGQKFVVFTLNTQGVPLTGPQVIGSGGPAHWMQWSSDQKTVYGVDIGSSKILSWPFVDGKVGAGKTALQLPGGDGPRHMAFHPIKPFIYIISEASNMVTAASVNADGTLTILKRYSSLPAGAGGQAAEIYVSRDGKNLYASNRGANNSIAVFAIGDDGLLTLLEHESTQGNWPRHFMVMEDAKILMVANERSSPNNIVAFKIAADGTLTPTGQKATVPNATFIGVLP